MNVNNSSGNIFLRIRGRSRDGEGPKIVFHPVDVIKREGTFYASAVLAVLETILLLKALRRPGDPRESTE